MDQALEDRAAGRVVDPASLHWIGEVVEELTCGVEQVIENVLVRVERSGSSGTNRTISAE